MKHPDHICRFNDAPQSCECYDTGYEKGYDSGYDDGRAAGTEEGKEEHHDFYCPANIEHKAGEKDQIDYFLEGVKEGYAKAKEETIAECTSILNEASYDKGYAAAIAEVRAMLGKLPDNWEEEKWRYNNELRGGYDEIARMLTQLDKLKP